MWQADCGNEFEPLDSLGKAINRRRILLLAELRIAPPAGSSFCAQGHPTLPRTKKRDSSEYDDRHTPDHKIDVGHFLQQLDRLHASLGPGNRSDHHNSGQFQVDIAKNAVRSGGHNRLSDDVSEVRAYDKIHR